ncbi:MAG: helix-turn-helix transcriptional regulator [Bacteroidales bacterium]|nr:helix-turn-helix transcriptional regulator [Bacteroidales bacterium]
MNPCFAIIDSNTLSAISLKEMLSSIFCGVEIHTYGSIERFIMDSNRHFIHFFASTDILFSNPEEFETLKEQTTIISRGAGRKFEEAGYNVLNVSLEKAEIAAQLLQLPFTSAGRKLRSLSRTQSRQELSDREKEVLRHMVKGLINKEIADLMGISVPTVIFHRNNICRKMNTRAIGRLAIYAVLSGIIDMKEI